MMRDDAAYTQKIPIQIQRIMSRRIAGDFFIKKGDAQSIHTL